MKEQLAQITEILKTIDKLPSFAVAAITREVTSRVSQWLYVTKDLSDAVATSYVLSDVSGDLEWKYVMELITVYAGQCIYIPNNMSENHPIAKAIGMDAAIYMSKRYGGHSLTVPKGEELLKAARDKAIVDDYKNNMNINDIANKYNLAYQWVMRLVLNCREENQNTKTVKKTTKKEQESKKESKPKPEKLVIC